MTTRALWRPAFGQGDASPPAAPPRWVTPKHAEGGLDLAVSIQKPLPDCLCDNRFRGGTRERIRLFVGRRALDQRREDAISSAGCPRANAPLATGFVTIGALRPHWKSPDPVSVGQKDGESVGTHTNRPAGTGDCFRAGRFVVVGKDGLRESSTHRIAWEAQVMEPGRNSSAMVWDGNSVAGCQTAWPSRRSFAGARAKRIPSNPSLRKQFFTAGGRFVGRGNLFRLHERPADWKRTLTRQLLRSHRPYAYCFNLPSSLIVFGKL